MGEILCDISHAGVLPPAAAVRLLQLSISAGVVIIMLFNGHNPPKLPLPMGTSGPHLPHGILAHLS